MRNERRQKTINMQNERNCKTRTLYLTKISFKKEFEIDISKHTEIEKMCDQETHVKINFERC